MRSLVSDTADPGQPMTLCDPCGHPRASMPHLEVAGKIACGFGHMVWGTLQILQPALCPPCPSPSTAQCWS